MQQIYTCTVEPHKKQPIIGFCLNPSCQQTPQYCYKCMMEKHQKHINDCKRFEDLSDLIQKLINENMRPVKVFFEIMKIITQQCQKTTQKIQKKLHEVLQIQKRVSDQQYSVLKENLEFLRKLYSTEFQDQKNLITQLCINKIYFQVKNQRILRINVKNKNLFQQISMTARKNILQKRQIFIESKGCQLLKYNQFDKAIIQFDLVLQKNSNQCDALSQKGKCLGYLKRYEEANKVLDIGLQINQNHYLLNLEKGNVLTLMNIQDQAIIYIEKAIKIDKNNSLSYYSKGCNLQIQNKDEEAIKYFIKAINLNPKYVEAFDKKGKSLHTLQKYEEAIQAYDIAIRLDHNYVSAQKNKGMSLKIDYF